MKDKPDDNIAPLVSDIYKFAKNPHGILDFEYHDVNQEEVSDWLRCFADGIQYVHENFSCVPRSVQVIDSIENDELKQKTTECIAYCKDRESILITRGFIVKELQTTRGMGAVFSNSNTGQETGFTGLQIATLLGVEEAYHCYQHRFLRDQYSDADWKKGGNQDNHGTQMHYQNNPIERDASLIVRQAAALLGFTNKSDGLEDSYSEP